MKIKPRGKRIVVKRDEAESVSAGGIVIPEAAKETKESGVIQLVGPECPDDIKVGDRVLFGKYAGTDYGNNCLLLDERDCVAIVEDD